MSVYATFNSIKDYPVTSWASKLSVLLQLFQFHQGLSYFSSADLGLEDPQPLSIPSRIIIKNCRPCEPINPARFQFHQGLSGEETEKETEEKVEAFNSIKDYQ